MTLQLKRFKVLCIGDSLALPGHHNKYEDTWYFRLKNNYPGIDFYAYFQRQLTTKVLNTMGGGKDGIDNFPKGADCLECFEPNLVILQLGIVDCAPRLLYRFERDILSHLPKSIFNLYVSLIKKIRKRNLKNTFVTINKFKNNIEKYILRAEKIKTNKIIFIAIPFADNNLVRKNEKILDNISLYNDILRMLEQKYLIFKVINPLKKTDQKIFQDGYHPNIKGHGLILEQLIVQLDEFKNAN